MIARLAPVCWGLATLLGVSSVSAQPAPAEPPASDASAALAYEPQYTPPPAPVADPAVAEAAAAPPGPPLDIMAFGGLDIGVPVTLDVNRDLIRPGANVHLQGGFDIGYVGFFLHAGWRSIPVDFDRAAKNGNPEYEGEGRDPLKNPHFGLGIKGQVPNDTPFRPYASVSFDFNFWNFRETTVSCAGSYYYAWYCNDHAVYKFTPGFSGRVGSAIDLERGIYLDFGLGMSMSMEGDFFDRNEVWLEPFGGVGFRS